MKEFSWNVFKYNINKNQIEVFNIFQSEGFYKNTNKLLKKSKSKEEFSKALRKESKYYFWSRYEYEIEINPLNNSDGEKIDIDYQLELNWDKLVDYLWNNK